MADPFDFDHESVPEGPPPTDLRHFEPGLHLFGDIPKMNDAATLEHTFENLSKSAGDRDAAEAYDIAAMLTEAYRIRANVLRSRRQRKRVRLYGMLSFTLAFFAGMTYIMMLRESPAMDSFAPRSVSESIDAFITVVVWGAQTPEVVASVFASLLSIVLMRRAIRLSSQVR